MWNGLQLVVSQVQVHQRGQFLLETQIHAVNPACVLYAASSLCGKWEHFSNIFSMRCFKPDALHEEQCPGLQGSSFGKYPLYSIIKNVNQSKSSSLNIKLDRLTLNNP